MNRNPDPIIILLESVKMELQEILREVQNNTNASRKVRHLIEEMDRSILQRQSRGNSDAPGRDSGF